MWPFDSATWAFLFAPFGSAMKQHRQHAAQRLELKSLKISVSSSFFFVFFDRGNLLAVNLRVFGCCCFSHQSTWKRTYMMR